MTGTSWQTVVRPGKRRQPMTAAPGHRAAQVA
jgi:hypothetical protein